MPLTIPQKIEEYFTLLLKKTNHISNPFEQSFFFFVHLPYLQAFEDVNKRVARLGANIPFIRKNLCPLSYVGVNQSEYSQSLLRVYERFELESVRALFVDAYERSANRYMTVRETVRPPEAIRVKYRSELKEVISLLVKRATTRSASTDVIRQFGAQHIALSDQTSFLELCETELLGLHEGNFARYQVTPQEFKKWAKAFAR